MFPLDFPHRVLQRANQGDWVLDPFSGRGTTNYAARRLGLKSIGIDSSTIAAALTHAKVANASPSGIVSLAQKLLKSGDTAKVPKGDFWRLAYAKPVLESICRLRTGLLAENHSDDVVALRAIILGSLHGPMTKGAASHFSNQCPRTWAPKPGYAVRFWTNRSLTPPRVDVLSIIERRAVRYYANERRAIGKAILGDSRSKEVFDEFERTKINWIITSPPYYGLKTYIPDQWIRNWFLGGPSTVDYSTRNQLAHSGIEDFAKDLRAVWINAHIASGPRAKLVVRFGAIANRDVDPSSVLKESLRESGWRISTIVRAGNANMGKRQAGQFGSGKSEPRPEIDCWAVKH